MSISPGGWISWAEQVPGHPEKVNPGVNAVLGAFLHSADGFEGYLRSNPPQPAAVGGQKSWHMSVMLDGRLVQHYGLLSRCWHATAANNEYIGIEHEGKIPNDPTLTPAQIATTRRVLAEIAAWKSVPWSWWRRPTSATDLTATLYEHREVTRWPGGSGSRCPSGRIPWDAILAGGEDDMVDDETLRILWAFCRSVIRGHYKLNSRGIDPYGVGHGREVVEILNPDGSQTNPRLELALREDEDV